MLYILKKYSSYLKAEYCMDKTFYKITMLNSNNFEQLTDAMYNQYREYTDRIEIWSPIVKSIVVKMSVAS